MIVLVLFPFSNFHLMLQCLFWWYVYHPKCLCCLLCYFYNSPFVSVFKLKNNPTNDNRDAHHNRAMYEIGAVHTSKATVCERLPKITVDGNLFSLQLERMLPQNIMYIIHILYTIIYLWNNIVYIIYSAHTAYICIRRIGGPLQVDLDMPVLRNCWN